MKEAGGSQSSRLIDNFFEDFDSGLNIVNKLDVLKDVAMSAVTNPRYI